MPRACYSSASKRQPQKERSPECGVRTAESNSRSPSPNSLNKRRSFKSKTSAEPSLEEHSARHSSRDNSSRLHGSKEQYCLSDDSGLDCPDELYNLTKLAEVSLAAAAGQFFRRGLYPRRVPFCAALPEQEYPEDLSRDSTDREEHACSDCGKRYSTSSNLARHRQTHRSLADKKARRCPHCDKIYVSMPAFAMHVRTHNQGCRCPFCGKCFSRPWLLQGHIRTHTGEKPFQCTVCNKAFADKSNLRAHVQTHSSLKPHVCTRCGKAFALKSYLYKHEESSCMKVPYEETKKLKITPILLPDSATGSGVE